MVLVCNNIIVGKNSVNVVHGTTRHETVEEKVHLKKLYHHCAHCKKRSFLASCTLCRCGLLLCTKHRYADEHDCTFDYKMLGREQLEKQLIFSGKNEFVNKI